MDILAQAVDSCPTAFIVINQQGIILESNMATATLFGYKKEELIGLAVDQLLSENLRKIHQKHVKNFFEKPSSRRMGDGRILSGKKKDGSEIYIEVGISFFERDDKRYAVANIVDITQQHKMRMLLNRTQEVARIGSWQVDLRQNKCLWSEMTYKIHDVEIGTKIYVEDGINFYVKNHQPIIKECIERSIATKEPWDIELKIKTTTGEERWVHAMGEPVVEYEEVVGLEGTFQDIHERKLLELERKSTLAKLAKAEELTSTGSWEWDVASETWSFSDQWHKIHGISQQILTTEELFSIAHPEDRMMVTLAFKKLLEEHIPYDIEHKIIRQDDKQVRYIRAIGRVELDKNNIAMRLVGASQDITKDYESRKLLLKRKRELEQSNEELSQFSYRTSHDLKAPLVTIRGLAEIIKEDIKDENYAEVEKNTNKIKSQVRRLENLVVDILNLAKADLRISDKEEINLEDIISVIKEKLEKVYLDNDVRIETSFKHSKSLMLSKTRITQVLENLISNAIKYCNKKKENRYVKISSDNAEDGVLITVEDNGIGIPQHFKERAFEMFERFHQEISFGSGLGL